MTGPKRNDPNDIAANTAEAIVTAESVASVLNPTGGGSNTTTRIVLHDVRERELSTLNNNNNQRKAHDRPDARPVLSKLCDETSVTLANVYQICPTNAQDGGGPSSSSTSHSYPRPYPLHPHQLAHQHTYPKISLTSITTPTCIKEEEEFGEASNGSDNGGHNSGTGVSTTDRPHDRRRLSAQYNTNQEMLAYNEAQERRYRRSDPTYDEDSATLRSFGHGQSGSNSASSSNVNIPRTFSTSALRMRNRTLFWDKTGYAWLKFMDAIVLFDWLALLIMLSNYIWGHINQTNIRL